MNQLIGLPCSPWTQKARWAMDFLGTPYRFRLYKPFLGEWGLRIRTRSFRGTVSVPVLLRDNQEPLTDSFSIARWADTEGRLATQTDEVTRWELLSQGTLASIRNRAVQDIAADPQAVREAAKGAVPSALEGAAVPFARWVVKRIGRKYQDCETIDVKQSLEKMAEQVSGPGDYLLGELTYADFAMASVLEGISPLSNGYARRGPASQKAWSDETLAMEFSGLVTWRNWLWETHGTPRNRPKKASGN